MALEIHILDDPGLLGDHHGNRTGLDRLRQLVQLTGSIIMLGQLPGQFLVRRCQGTIVIPNDSLKFGEPAYQHQGVVSQQYREEDAPGQDPPSPLALLHLHKTIGRSNQHDDLALPKVQVRDPVPPLRDGLDQR